MPLSIRDRKLLWARSGNLCTFPGCTQQLVQAAVEAGEHFVVGEEAHIVAHRPGGPRGTSGIAAGLDDIANRILLCPTHHRVIDAQPLAYPPEVLRDFKVSHEMRIRGLLSANERMDAYQLSQYRSVCGSLRTVNAWRFESAAVVVCSFGSDPVPSAGDKWRGAGLEFKQVHDVAGVELLFTSSEADPDVEYWVNASTFHLVQSTYEPEAGELVPFVERKFVVGVLPAVRSTRLLLQPPASGIPTLRDVLLTLRNLNRGQAAEAEVLLYRLRNAGLADPDSALTELEKLRGQWWYDGANSEAATAIAGELNLVKALRSNSR